MKLAGERNAMMHAQRNAPVRRFALAATQETAAHGEGDVDQRPTTRRNSGRGLGRQLRSVDPLLDIWDPLATGRSWKDMLNAVDRMMDAPLFRTPVSVIPSRMRLSHDIVEDSDAYRLRIDMPGLSKEEVKVTVEDGQLVIKGEQNAEDKSNDGWSSRSYENYNTRLTLPEHVQLNEVKAELKNGVLRVLIPKCKEDPKKHAIPIEVQ